MQRLAQYRWYLLDGVQMAAVGFAAVALIPAGTHFFEMSGDMRLRPADYLTVQAAQHGWTLFAVSALLAAAAVGVHTYLVRRNACAFGWSVIALLGLGAAQVVCWAVAFPISIATDGWKALPVDYDFETARRHWEYALATAGVLTFGGLLAFVRAIEASRPFASISILQSIERDAAVRAARMRALSADGDKQQQLGSPISRQTKAA